LNDSTNLTKGNGKGILTKTPKQQEIDNLMITQDITNVKRVGGKVDVVAIMIQLWKTENLIELPEQKNRRTWKSIKADI
jgi:hypothetical protein